MVHFCRTFSFSAFLSCCCRWSRQIIRAELLLWGSVLSISTLFLKLYLNTVVPQHQTQRNEWGYFICLLDMRLVKKVIFRVFDSRSRNRILGETAPCVVRLFVVRSIPRGFAHEMFKRSSETTQWKKNRWGQAAILPPVWSCGEQQRAEDHRLRLYLKRKKISLLKNSKILVVFIFHFVAELMILFFFLQQLHLVWFGFTNVIILKYQWLHWRI